MGAVNLDNTGSGSAITLSSDGTSLLLDGTAIGGGSSLDLFVENPSSPTTPLAGGTNGVAIGSGSNAGGSGAIAIGNGSAAGDGAFCAINGGGNTAYGAVGNRSIAMGEAARAQGQDSVAIGENSLASSADSFAIGYNTDATATNASAFGYNAQAAGGNSVALGNSRAGGTDSFAAAIANNTSSYGATNTGSIAFGNQNKAAGYESFVAGGYANTANNYRSSVLNGTSNTVNSNYGTILGGENNTINSSSNYSIILCGERNEAGQQYTVASGLRAKTSVRGQWAHSAGHFSATGDAQSSKYVLRSDTTDATAEVLTSTNSAGGINNQVDVPTDAAVAFHGTIVAKQSGSANAAAWTVEGLIVNNGGTTTLTNSATTVISNTPSWGMTLSADDTNDVLAITVTGAAATDIRWVATIHTSEVIYA